MQSERDGQHESAKESQEDNQNTDGANTPLALDTAADVKSGKPIHDENHNKLFVKGIPPEISDGNKCSVLSEYSERLMQTK